MEIGIESKSAALAIDDGQTRAGSVSDLSDLTEAHLDRIFAVFVRDMAEQAVQLHGQASATEAQSTAVLAIVAKPRIDAEAEQSFVTEVLSFSSAYEMKP